MSSGTNHWQFWIDTGGTFTDCIAIDPQGKTHRTKVLSSSRLRGKIVRVIPPNRIRVQVKWGVVKDILAGYDLEVLGVPNSTRKIVSFDGTTSDILIDDPVNGSWSGMDFEITGHEEAPILACRLLTQTKLHQELPSIDMRLGSTKGTNALLERKGAKVTFVVTKGFKDLIQIGNQQRPRIFELDIHKNTPLYHDVLEVEERVDSAGTVSKPLSENSVKEIVGHLAGHQTDSVAIGLLNSYVNPVHELQIGRELRKAGFGHISESHRLAPMIKLLIRSQTAIVNAYLAPVIEQYVNSVKKKLQDGLLKVMTSAGGLVGYDLFEPKDSLLSGPAGGVVGAATSAHRSGENRILSFDMGGTSTDVSRFDQEYDYQFESKVGDAHIYSPSISIKTVAAGGGSICNFDGIKFSVGPESAGANPGPACYGSGGPLTITDVNLLLGRMDYNSFGIPITVDAAERSFEKLVAGIDAPKEQILAGFLDIANEKMAEAIRSVSVSQGFDASKFTLLSFGGAGGQHACRIAELLNMDRILVPADAGLLSAYGMGNARIERFAESTILQQLENFHEEIPLLMEKLEGKAIGQLLEEGFSSEETMIRSRKLSVRFQGQDTPIEIDYESPDSIAGQFRSKYERLFAHWIDDRSIELESARVVASSLPSEAQYSETPLSSPKYFPDSSKEMRSYVDRAWISVPVFRWINLLPGAHIKGPALITSSTSTTFLDKDWEFTMDVQSQAILNRVISDHIEHDPDRPDQVQLELFTNRFTATAEEMGKLLQRTSFSVNIKERLDFSCAILDRFGELVVNAPHIPVHLGSLGVCTRKVLEVLDLGVGDVAITNHPGFGGSHLPDITLIAPVYSNEEILLGYVANRAHHAEIGGRSPGSMPPEAKNLQEEGIVIEPTYLVRKGRGMWDSIAEILQSGPYPSRALQENIADLKAALASVRWGQAALIEASGKFGAANIHLYMDQLKEYARICLSTSLSQIKNGLYEATELLDDGTRIHAAITVKDGSAEIDFAGSSSTHPGNLNANPSVVGSAVLYVLRLLIKQDIPLNEGLMKAIHLKIPRGFLNPSFPSSAQNAPAVVGGNTETSQRVTDTLIKALGLAACSQGTMNNLLFGDARFGYYETIAGGTGAGPGFNGQHAVHQHMTNTRITDAEILEMRYPAQVERFEIRTGSGGAGKWTGGDGVIREILFHQELDLTILSQHRLISPYGLKGGDDGKVGVQSVVRANGVVEALEGIASCKIFRGDRLIIETPGGGGYGKPGPAN